MLTTVEGHYQCTAYVSTGDDNDWHHVTVTKNAHESFAWTNRANVSWTLDKNTLAPGPDCCYYPGCDIEVKKNEFGMVTCLVFCGEAYDRIQVRFQSELDDDEW